MKAEILHLVDTKRSNAVDIGLSRFKMTHEQIRDAIWDLDSAQLTLERTQTLVKLIPTQEEMEQLKDHEADIQTLGNTERFFLTVGSIPKLEARLKAFAFKQDWEEIVSGSEANVNLLDRCCVKLRSSKPLHETLETILAIGNYLNGGTAKGAQWGFRLNTLSKVLFSCCNPFSSFMLFFLFWCSWMELSPAIRKCHCFITSWIFSKRKIPPL